MAFADDDVRELYEIEQLRHVEDARWSALHFGSDGPSARMSAGFGVVQRPSERLVRFDPLQAQSRSVREWLRVNGSLRRQSAPKTYVFIQSNRHARCLYESWLHRLTGAQAEAIRVRYRNGHVTQLALAREFKISQSSVMSILSGSTYKHAGGPIYWPRRGYFNRGRS